MRRRVGPRHSIMHLATSGGLLAQLAAVAAAVIAIVGGSGAAAAADRVALVIGIEEYKTYKSSEQSAKRAADIAAGLKSAGFEVILGRNPNDAEARESLRAFAESAKGAEFAIAVLIGHVATANGNAFLLTNNVRLRQSTDLLTQGVPIATIASIAGRAEQATVLVLPTVADIPTTITGVEGRLYKPQSLPPNVTMVYSTSERVPLSRIDGLSRQAAADLAQVAGEKPLRLAALANAAAAGGVGLVVGEIKDRDLSVSQKRAAAADSPEARAREEALRQERLVAERRAKEAEERARQAEDRARQADQRAAQATAQAQAQAKAQAAAPAQVALQQPQAPSAAPQPPAESDDVTSLQVIEGLMGREQRQEIQRNLQRVGLYTGPIDGIYGPLTRQAIEDFQRQGGQASTGYLTPQQVQALFKAKAQEAAPPRQDGVQLVADIQIPADATRWDMDGLNVRLIARGTQRTFVRVGETGEKMVVFDGRRDANGYVGTAYVPLGACGAVGFPASGKIGPDNATVTLVGLQPVMSPSCEKQSERETRITFTRR